jgi:hypothetical protein
VIETFDEGVREVAKVPPWPRQLFELTVAAGAGYLAWIFMLGSSGPHSASLMCEKIQRRAKARLSNFRASLERAEIHFDAPVLSSDGGLLALNKLDDRAGGRVDGASFGWHWSRVMFVHSDQCPLAWDLL